MTPSKYNIKRSFTYVLKNFQLCWYGFFSSILTLYVLLNWPYVTDFVFFSKFDGSNLLFILWLLLLLLLLINRFEGFGLKVESQLTEALEKNINTLLRTSLTFPATNTQNKNPDK